MCVCVCVCVSVCVLCVGQTRGPICACFPFGSLSTYHLSNMSASSLPRCNTQFKPIIIHGHNKPLTTVKYNLDGDLLFTAGKDRKANVYYADTGNRLGTYGYHKGAVWDLDPSWDSSYVVTACADAYARLFKTTTGIT
jgi:WD40 repeat protein